jgi:hypothetical protein
MGLGSRNYFIPHPFFCHIFLWLFSAMFFRLGGINFTGEDLNKPLTKNQKG